MVDLAMPQIIGSILLAFYKNRISTMSETIDYIHEHTDLQKTIRYEDKDWLVHKVKQLLVDILLGFFPGSEEYQVIELDSQIIGFVKVVASKADVYLGEIQITKKFQNLGIGTDILNSIIEEAKVNKQSLWLRVIKGNPAEKLYKRLGFTTFAVDSTHKKLEIKR